MARIAVVHVPLYSHLGAAMRLSAVLAEQGHELVMWGPEWSRSDIEATGAQFVRLEVEMPSEPTFIGHAAKVAGRAEQHAGHLIDQFYGHDVDAVVHDSLALWACVAAEHLGLPRVVSHPMFPIIDPYQLPPDVQRTPPAPSDPAAALAEFETNWKSIARRWGVEIGSPHAVVHSTPRSDATIVYTTELIMDGRFRPPPRWHYVGPLMEPRPPATYPGENPLVYVCFGTCFNRRRKLFDSVIEGLADEPVDVVIATGKRNLEDDTIISAESLAPLPPNMVAEDFVDGRAMLAQASVHITHGGCNSVHESLLAGVPMLFMPQAYDQAPLGKCVKVLGAGEFAREVPAEVRAHTRLLLENGTAGERARDVSRHLQDFDGSGRVAEVFERVLDGAPLKA